MQIAPRNLIAVVTAVAVLFSAAGCICAIPQSPQTPTTAAATHSAGHDHSCCSHEPGRPHHSPTQPDQQQHACRHCTGLTAFELPRGHDALATPFTLIALLPAPGADAHPARVSLPLPAGPFAQSIVSSVTLLSLHCALLT